MTSSENYSGVLNYNKFVRKFYKIFQLKLFWIY